MLKICEISKKRHLPCYARTMNLVVNGELKLEAIKKIIEKCKTIVKFFKFSAVATATLNNIQREKIKTL